MIKKIKVFLLNHQAISLLLICTLGLLVRLNGINTSVWMDEAATATFSTGNSIAITPVGKAVHTKQFLKALQVNPQQGIKDVIQNSQTWDVHPPSYFILNYLWISLFDNTPNNVISIICSRILSVVFSLLMIPVAFITAKKLFQSKRVALISSGLTALSPVSIALSHEILA